MDETDNNMTDERAKTIEGFKVVFDIISKYAKPHEHPIGAAEHDVIYLNLDTDQCPEVSKDGKLLGTLGCHVEKDEYWAMFV